MTINKRDTTVAIVGLGYVGLPLAVAFARAGFRVIGFDINSNRIAELENGKDRTGEIGSRHLREKSLAYTADASKLREADFVIVAVPTPVLENKKPDLEPLRSASEIVGKNLGRGAVVVYESTVWPGLTEEYCVPILERFSKKKCGKDFFIGYSPERINPGDKKHRLETIVKVVAGMDKKTLEKVARVYGRVSKAGVFKAASIKVAEAAKVIENTQRDLNIALMNELAMLFKKIGVSTKDVLEAAETKWNFGRYRPGMVGGHCIPVDPYYLTALAKRLGYHPKVILAGRIINNAMPKYVVSLLEEGLRKKAKGEGQKAKRRILVLGLTFKENVPDTRNSPARELIKLLRGKGYSVMAYDPHVSADEAKKHFKVATIPWPSRGKFDGAVVTVAHRQFTKLSPARIKKLLGRGGVLVDVRGALKRPGPDIEYKTL